MRHSAQRVTASSSGVRGSERYSFDAWMSERTTRSLIGEATLWRKRETERSYTCSRTPARGVLNSFVIPMTRVGRASRGRTWISNRV
jgi:hypothetical protein